MLSIFNLFLSFVSLLAILKMALGPSSLFEVMTLFILKSSKASSFQPLRPIYKMSAIYRLDTEWLAETKSILKIRMVQVSRFVVTKKLPKSLWASKSCKNSYQRV